MIGDVVEHESVQHDIERALRKLEPTGVSHERLVGLAGFGNGPDRCWFGIDRREAKARGGEEVSAWICPAANRQHRAVLERNAPREEPLLLRD